jgi:ubiquinone/menaquinone biosynthesis C-methylase UbiE
MDYDNQCGFWIHDLPYVWIEGKKLESCKRYYILDQDTLILHNNKIKKIEDLNEEEIYIPNINCLPTHKGWAKNYFLISTFKDLSSKDIRVNGSIINFENTLTLTRYIIVPPEWSNLNKIYFYYPPFEIIKNGILSYYHSGSIIKTLYENKYGKVVEDFLGNKLRGVDKNVLYPLLYSNYKYNDKVIFEEIKRIYKPRTNFGAWGGKFGKTQKPEITGKAKSRIDEIKSVINGNVFRRYLDIGSGNGEIAYGIGSYIKAETIMMDIKDNRDEIFKGGKFLKIDEDEIIKLESNSVDLITIFQTLHHVQNIHLLMNELRRVIKKDGIIIIREHDCGNKYDARMIDLEHMMYDIVFENKTYEESVKEYYALYFSSDDFDELFKYYDFKLVKHLNAYSKSNETKYYYGVYKADSFKEKEIKKKRILDNFLKNQIDRIHPGFRFSDDALEYIDIMINKFFGMINKKEDPKEQLRRITESETQYLLKNVFEAAERFIFKKSDKARIHIDADYYDIFDAFKNKLVNFSDEYIFYFSMFIYLFLEEVTELSGNAMRDNTPVGSRDKIKIVHIKLAIEYDSEMNDYKFTHNIDLEDKDIKRYDILNMNKGEYIDLIRNIIKLSHKKDFMSKYEIYSDGEDKVIASQEDAKIILMLTKIVKNKNMGLNILKKSGINNPSLNQIFKIFENEIKNINTVAKYNKELHDSYIKDGILSIWEISKHFRKE